MSSLASELRLAQREWRRCRRMYGVCDGVTLEWREACRLYAAALIGDGA